jgi:hypothetical protein
MRNEGLAETQLPAWSSAAWPISNPSSRLLSGAGRPRPGRARTPTELADELIAACVALRSRLDASPARRDEEEAEAELLAAAGVFKNAGVLFGSLDLADADRQVARIEACASLLVQGAHHVDMFLAAIGRYPPHDGLDNCRLDEQGPEA